VYYKYSPVFSVFMGHAIMLPEHHYDECAGRAGDAHTLYIREGDSPWRQRFRRIGVVCSACYKVNLDNYWIQENEDNYETVKRKIPKSRRRLGSAEKEERMERLKEISNEVHSDPIEDKNDTG
jgi:hypothetical protein